jgi:Protein of unknown function (DUF3891)
MIIRGEQDGKCILVNQTDHSQLVGQLASHWGNAKFEPPSPYESVVRAAIFHDYGWLPYETAPGADSKTGKPYSFLQVGLQKSQLEAYRWVIDWMNNIDPYAALIISMHRTGLWRGRYGAIEYPTAFNLNNPPPEVAKFIGENESWQEMHKKSLETTNLRGNYRLMQVWDLLGLYFCCQEVSDDYISPVPLSYSTKDHDGARMTMKPENRTRITFSPYPFDVRPLKIQLRVKSLPAARFNNDEDFRKGYFQARNDWIEFELV